MNTMQKGQNFTHGRLPAMAPLANPYVPFQMEQPVKYDARMGLVRGTMYPGLELPFKGMVNRNPLPVTPMTEMQALAFAVQDIALYLDTHRDDNEALELYQQYQKMLAKSKAEYAQHHGSVTHTEPTNSEHYEWLSDPWPWEYAKNREV